MSPPCHPLTQSTLVSPTFSLQHTGGIQTKLAPNLLSGSLLRAPRPPAEANFHQQALPVPGPSMHFHCHLAMDFLLVLT